MKQGAFGQGVGQRWRSLLVVLALIGTAPLLAACSSDDGDELAYVERPVEDIYNKAMDLMLDGKYRQAAAEFDEVERQHPYSTWSRRANLMAAYCNYQVNEYDAAVLAAQRFITLYPGSSQAAYAYYLVALSYYEQISDVRRDQRMTELALSALQEVVRRYPQSEYATDARLKIDLTVDHLAGKEMEIGRYYLKRRAYVAAINRFRTVVTRYQTTSHVPEALHRLTEAYVSMGILTEAQTAAAILGYNYPGSDWYEDSYALLAGEGVEPKRDESSWISQAWDSVF